VVPIAATGITHSTRTTDFRHASHDQPCRSSTFEGSTRASTRCPKRTTARPPFPVEPRSPCGTRSLSRFSTGSPTR
jgi:hypothetical protein